MTARAARVALSLGCAVIAATLAPGARAASRIVVVEDATRATRDATARLRAELVAAGFDVESRGAGDADARHDVDAGDDASVATVRLSRDPATRATELWVSDRLTGKTLVRRVNADPERQPRLVAIRGVELLRASLLELASPPHDEAPPVTPAMAQPAPPEVAKLVAPAPPAREASAPPPPAPPKRWFDRVAIDAGPAVLASTEGLGAGFAASIGAWLPLGAHLAVRPRLVGPAFRSLVNPAGTADVRQELAVVHLAWAPFDAAVAPYVELGGGPYHLHVDGTAQAPYHGESDDVWALAGSGALGVRASLAPTVAFALDAGALLVTPHPSVAIGGVRVASVGAPSLLGSLSLVASF